MNNLPDHSVVCDGCGNVVAVDLPDFGVDTFDCDCGYMVMVERSKNKIDIAHFNPSGQIVMSRTHYTNKKKGGK